MDKMDKMEAGTLSTCERRRENRRLIKDTSKFEHWLLTMPEELRRLVLPATRVLLLRRTSKTVRAILGAASTPAGRVNAVVHLRCDFFEGRLLRDAFAGLDAWCRVTVLRFKRVHFSVEAMQALAGWLRDNSTLGELDLRGYRVGDEGARALANALRVNRALCSLVLCNNDIGDGGAQRLAQALCVNKTLRELDISSNKVTADGARALAAALRVNTTLERLDLGFSRFSDGAALTLLDALRFNSTLRALKLNGTGIRENEALALAEVRSSSRSVPLLHKNFASADASLSRIPLLLSRSERSVLLQRSASTSVCAAPSLNQLSPRSNFSRY